MLSKPCWWKTAIVNDEAYCGDSCNLDTPQNTLASTTQSIIAIYFKRYVKSGIINDKRKIIPITGEVIPTVLPINRFEIGFLSILGDHLLHRATSNIRN